MGDKHQKEIERLKKRIKTLNAKLKRSLETGSRFFKGMQEFAAQNKVLKKMLIESYREEPISLRETLQRHFLHDGD